MQRLYIVFTLLVATLLIAVYLVSRTKEEEYIVEGQYEFKIYCKSCHLRNDLSQRLNGMSQDSFFQIMNDTTLFNHKDYKFPENSQKKIYKYVIKQFDY